MKYITTVDNREYLVDIIDDHQVSVDGVDYQVDFTPVGNQQVYSLVVDGKSVDANVFINEDMWHVLFQGTLYSATVEDEREKRLRAAMGGRVAARQDFNLRAPMPGMVISIPVEEGQDVQKGDVLAVLESMKMQNELRSPRDGRVTRLRIKPGDRVEQRDTMLSVV